MEIHSGSCTAGLRNGATYRRACPLVNPDAKATHFPSGEKRAPKMPRFACVRTGFLSCVLMVNSSTVFMSPLEGNVSIWALSLDQSQMAKQPLSAACLPPAVADCTTTMHFPLIVL